LAQFPVEEKICVLIYRFILWLYMVRREVFVNKIRTLDYYFKSEQKRTYLYRKRGGTHFISVPMADQLEDEFVISTLCQAGLSLSEARSFLASAKS
jgi:hypothetical protein